jgi:hypothetical protein
MRLTGDLEIPSAAEFKKALCQTMDSSVGLLRVL